MEEISLRTEDDVRAYLQGWLQEIGREDPAVIERLLPAFLPAIGLEGSPDGASRLGGLPELPAGTEWPIRPVPDDLQDWVSAGGSTHEPHLRRYLERPWPLELLATLDLPELQGLGECAADLPGSGRLLIFYDIAAGPWRDGRDVCRVIWDESDPAERRVIPAPAAFDEVFELERADARAQAKTSSFSEEELLSFVRGYVHPETPVRPASVRQLVSTQALEWEPLGLDAFLEDEGDEGESLMDAGFEDLNYEGAVSFQILGSPLPEQSDPRLVAAALTGDAIPGESWVLLLQADVAELMGTEGEGTVYILIPKEALAARRFEEAVGVYQQT